MKTGKFLSLVLAVVMLLACAMPMSAAAANITINDGDSFANNYAAYRLLNLSTILTCDEAIGAGHVAHNTDCYGYAYTLRLASEGSNAGLVRNAVLSVLGITTGTLTEAQINALVIAAINAKSDDPSDARTFDQGIRKLADDVYAELVAANVTPDATSSSEVFTGLPQGYYLIVDTTHPLEENDATSKFILDTMGQNNITINAKKDVPTVDKKIWQHNAGTLSTEATPANAATGSWEEYTDVNIGDIVYYMVPGTLPSNLQDFVKYYYGITDTMSAGLTYQNDMTVTYYANAANAATKTGGTSVTSFFNITATPDSTQTIIVADCADILDDTGLSDAVTVTKDGVFVFEYTAKLNSDAVIGNDGNPNEVYLTYSSNPNPNGAGEPNDETNDTPKEYTVVFTYELDVTKVDTDKKTITTDTAEFVLYRMSGSDKEYAILAGGSVASWTTARGSATTIDNTMPGGIGKFSVVGLDAGTYYLEETKAPTGYNLLTDPIEFVIAATIELAGGDYKITEMTIAIDGEAAENGVLSTGVVSMDVVNGTGPKFPGTGGIGRKLFVLGGLLLIGLCTGGFIVYRKRRILDSLKTK